MKYDRTDTFEKDVPFYNHYKVEKSVPLVPDYYVIPQAWFEVINRMKANGVKMEPLKKDTLISVEFYHIEDFKTVSNPYEGHYLHYNTKVNSSVQKMTFRKGDYLINTQQKARRYLVETLNQNLRIHSLIGIFLIAFYNRKKGSQIMCLSLRLKKF